VAELRDCWLLAAPVELPTLATSAASLVFVSLHEKWIYVQKVIYFRKAFFQFLSLKKAISILFPLAAMKS